MKLWGIPILLGRWGLEEKAVPTVTNLLHLMTANRKILFERTSLYD